MQVSQGRRWNRVSFSAMKSFGLGKGENYGSPLSPPVKSVHLSLPSIACGGYNARISISSKMLVEFLEFYLFAQYS